METVHDCEVITSCSAGGRERLTSRVVAIQLNENPVYIIGLQARGSKRHKTERRAEKESRVEIFTPFRDKIAQIRMLLGNGYT